MKKSFYLPSTDVEKKAWLINFSTKLPNYTTLFGLVAADVTAVANYSSMFSYLMDNIDKINTAKESFVQYKNLIRNGVIGSAVGAFPTLPTLPAAPTAVPAGIFPLIAKLVQTIKNNQKYTDAIGQDLGIIGSDQPIDPTTMKPILNLVSSAAGIDVQWTKGAANALRIEVDRTGAGFQFLAIDSIPNYMDTVAPTAPATWKYRAVYLIHDEIVGQWSDVVSINVG